MANHSDIRYGKLLIPTALAFVLFAPAAGAQNLSALYQLALQNNPVLKQAEARRLATGESKNQSVARFLPNISLSANSSRNRLVINKSFFEGFEGALIQNYWHNEFNINLSQPLFHLDHWIQLSQSENQIAQTEAAYQAELQNLMIKTGSAYFDVLAAKDNLAFAAAEKEAIARQLEQAKERYEVGLVAITDVNEAQAGYDQAVANEIDAANTVDNQQEALAEIIGITASALDPLGEKLPLIKPEPADIEAWSSLAEAGNFEIIQAVNSAEIARKTIDLQRSNHLPKVDLVASYGQTDDTSIFGLRSNRESIGLQFNLPLFEGGAVNSRTRQASYEYQAARENVNAKKREVKRRVKNAYRGILATMSRVEALASTVNSAQSAVEASEAGFAIGTRTMIDVLNDQRNLYRAKRDYARTRYDYLVNSLKLKQAAGNLTIDDLYQINNLLQSPYPVSAAQETAGEDEVRETNR